MRRRSTYAAVFLISLIILGFNLGGPGLAETYIDPISHIPAQDEAVYSSTALHMAQSGGWLTPMFLGRFAFYKPPVVYWAAGAAALIFGPSAWALRLPCLLSGAAVVTLLFAWMWAAYSLTAALAGSLLLLSDRTFHVLSRLVLTDMLVTLCIAVAMVCVFRDPELRRTRSLWLFGAATGAAILTKSLAGLLPLMMLAGSRAGIKRFVHVCGVAALVAAPWHLYQLLIHTRWFWAEYVLTENFTWAVAAPSQSTQENQILYYLKRLAVTDPLLGMAALAGIPTLIRRRDRLLITWTAVALLALIAFGYRNTSYLLLLVPPLVLIASGALQNPIVAALVSLGALWQLAYLPYTSEHPLTSVPALRAYCDLHRPNDLIIIDPDDEFVSSTLPIRHVRYCFFETNPNPVRLPLDFRQLGITVTVDEYGQFDQLRTGFENRLRGFGLLSGAPVATVIEARAPEDFGNLIGSHPDVDFSLPERFRQYAGTGHMIWKTEGGRVYLLGISPAHAQDKRL